MMKMAQSSGGKVTSEKVAEKEYRILIAMGEADRKSTRLNSSHCG